MAASALAMQIAQWIARGRQGPPPAGATAQDIAAAGLPPPATGTTDSGDAVTSGPPGPTTEAATAAERVLPYPEPKDEYERARNQEQRLLWQLEDADAAITAARANPTSPDYFNIPQLETNRSRINSDLTAQQGTVQRALAAREVEEKKKPHTVQKQERGPDGETYVVTYDVDAAGNEKWNGQKPVKLDLGTDPNAAVELQTAQVNLERARQQLAQEQDPLKRAQLQAQVEQAQFTLQQARAKAPLEQRLQELSIQQAEQNLNRPSVQTVGGRAVGLDPLTGRQTFATDLMSPEERARAEATADLQLEAAQRGTLPQNAYAAYTQERSRLQTAGRAEIDRLQELQRQGVLSAQQAESQFQQWLGPRQAQLEGLQAAASEAQRAEQQRVDELNVAEERRVAAANQAREQTAFGVGESARQQLAALLPNVRTPQFLAQYGGLVERMAQRAQAPSAEAAAALPRGTTFSADTFNPANFRGVLPDLESFAKAATDRALAAISPTVAQRIGFNAPPLPTGDALTGLINKVGYAGPLLRAPQGGVPLPDQNAIDLGTGQARTVYPGGSWLDWPIGAPPT